MLNIHTFNPIQQFIKRFSRSIQYSSVCFSNEKGVYGYRKPREFIMEDYTTDEQKNRSLNSNLFRLVYAYRNYGHLAADLDPLGLEKRNAIPELDPSRYGIPESGVSFDLSGIIHIGKKQDSTIPIDKAPIELILSHLKKVYCGKIAYEFRHIPNILERRWFANMVESFDKRGLTRNEKKYIFQLLTKSEVFDHFMGKRFPQVKRYGLEGAESMMVALDALFKSSSNAGIIENVVCMPHRGRLNLLTDLFQFDTTAMFHKILGNSEFPSEMDASGDVLSHLANSLNVDTGSGRPLHISMLHNPSHLEAVNPVALGKARAKQTWLLDNETEGPNCALGDRVMCIQLHGDAAFSGQGVVMETLGLSNLPHFSSGGSIHVVVNNQIGYTTQAMNSRSSIYASDVAKMINAPIIHVNGDFPEQVAYAASLAFEYRNMFKKDIVLDLITYRRWGHNELDEPAFTQPIMYKSIRGRKSVPTLYEEKLVGEGVIDKESIESFRSKYLNVLENHLVEAKSYTPKISPLTGKWTGLSYPTEISNPITGVNRETLKKIGIVSVSAPNVNIHSRLMKHHVQSRLSKIESGKNLDWASAEALAVGSLLLEGYSARISGQDVGRGTFSQRHFQLVDQETEQIVVPLNGISNQQGHLEVANSSLSEMAVLGFEYGMSLENPKCLNIWEAQFGDFFNGAQVIIDAYLCSGEQKWLKQSGLVMLLPHGYDGAGPEHSSCRIERFLQLSDEPMDIIKSESKNPNWHVINPTTPAQYFHALRRQMKRNYRKPLIVVAPKTLLKSSAAVSDISEMSDETRFKAVLTENRGNSINKVVFVSGKLYYDLVKGRAERGLEENVHFIRIEELCPFPAKEIQEAVKDFKNVEYVWCQEEPENMGAYSFMLPRLTRLLNVPLRYVGREAAAAPATGIGKRHKKEQAAIIENCFK